MFKKTTYGLGRDDSLIAAARKRRRRLIPAVIAVIVVVNALIFLAVRSDAFKTWRANRLAHGAIEDIARGDYAAAAGRAVAAMQLSPKDPDVIRATALLNLKMGSPQADPFYHTLLVSGGWLQDDILDAEEAALASGDLQFFQKLQDMLPAGLRETARSYALLSSYFVAAGNLPMALQAAQVAAKREPTNTGYAAVLSELLLMSGTPDGVAQAWRALEKIASGKKPAEARQALRILITSTQIPRASRLDYARRLAAMKGASLDDKLAAATVSIDLDPAQKDETVKDLISRYSKGDPDTLKALGVWLVHDGEPAKAEALFPLEVALSRKDYFLIWLDAVAGQGRWQEVQTVLRNENVPLEAPYMFLYRGRAAAELGDDFASGKNYDNAVESARGDATALVYIGAYFRKMGLWQDEIRCLRQMADIPSASRYAWEGLLSVYRSRQDTGEVLKTLQEMAGLWPNDKAVQNDATYLNLLLGQDLSTCLADSQRRHQEFPGMLPYSITYALALLENGSPAQALDLFRKSNVPLDNLLPWQRAVFAAILAGNGYGAAAGEVAATIPRGDLTAGERAFLERYLSAGKH